MQAHLTPSSSAAAAPLVAVLLQTAMHITKTISMKRTQII